MLSLCPIASCASLGILACELVQRNVSNEIIADVDAKPALAPLRSDLFQIDGLHQFTQSIRCQTLHFRVLPSLLNKAVQIIHLLSLPVDLVPQHLNLFLQLRLFVLVAFAHQSKAFIRNAARYIVLINSDEKAVQFIHAPLRFCKAFPAHVYPGFAFQSELFLHQGTEVVLMISDIL